MSAYTLLKYMICPEVELGLLYCRCRFSKIKPVVIPSSVFTPDIWSCTIAIESGWSY